MSGDGSARWRVGEVVDGRYEVTALLGRGGMGEVFRVRHLGWGTDLAVKSPLLGGADSPRRRELFTAEAQTWVSLGLHPHVCGCHYVRTIGGVPRVFAEYVPGGSLADRIRSRQLYAGGEADVLARILDVAVQTAWGLEHAHRRGVVHQDVKPANVLLDDSGTAKITDFGLARAHAAALTGSAEVRPGASLLLTGGGMTPAYAAPEQAAGHRVGARSDLFSFGVSVLEMFTGEVRWLLGPLAEGVLETCRAEGSAGEGLPPIPPELARVLARCLRQDPADRPASVASVAVELAAVYRRLLGRPYPRPEPRAADLLAAEHGNRALSLLDLGDEEGATAAFAAALETDPQHLATRYNSGLLGWRRGRITDEALLADLAAVGEAGPDDAGPALLTAQVHLERGDLTGAGRLLAAAEDRPGPEHPELAAARRAAAALGAPADQVRAIAWYHCAPNRLPPDFPVSTSADGRLALTAVQGGLLRLWDLTTGQCLRELDCGEDGVPEADLGADGRQALVAGRDGAVRLWDLRDGGRLLTLRPDGIGQATRMRRPLLHQEAGVALVPIAEPGDFGPFDTRGRVEVWDLRTGRARFTIDDGLGWEVAGVFGPDGRQALVTGYADGAARLWDLEAGRRLQVLPRGVAQVATASFAADGRHLVTGEHFSRAGGALRLWDLTTGQCLRVLTGHTHRITAVRLSPDLRLLLSGSMDGTARLWDLATGRCLRTYRGHGRDVELVQLDQAGGTVRTGSSDNTLRRWNLTGWYTAPYLVSRPQRQGETAALAGRVRALVEEAERARTAGDHSTALTLLGRARAVPGHERSPAVLAAWRGLALHTTRTGLRSVWSRQILTGHPSNVLSVALSADARTAVTSGSDRTVRLWEVASGDCGHVLPTRDIGRAAMSGDGSRLLHSTFGGELSVWSAESGERLVHLDGCEVRASLPASFSADGRHALVIGSDHVVRLWDLDRGRVTAELVGHRAQVHTAHLDTAAGIAVTGGRDLTVRLWDLGSGRCLRTLRGHGRTVVAARLSADGRHVLSSADQEPALRLWDAATGGLLRVFEPQPRFANAVRLGPDGRFALSAGEDATARLWETGTGRCLRVLPGHGQRVIGADFTPDGRYGVSWSIDAVQLWEFDWELAVVSPASPA
ncbi:protein kinase [Streptomyces roseolus]|uniref:protein kinase domain-containing protein n=1 Tax=Streptomyces roseolus TaxID=67358 RepID=UPI0033EA6707